MSTAATARSEPSPAPEGRGGDRPVLRLLGREAAAELAGRVGTARELERHREGRKHPPFPTGLAPLDELLDGGLARGRLVELVGRPGGGRFAAVLTTLATATAGGEAAALVDLGGHLDPESLAVAGAEASRLLWVRPRHVRQALAAAETLLDGGFPLVVVDLGTPPVPGGRGREAGWVRLARAARGHGAALLVSSPYRVSGTAAHTVLQARLGRSGYAPRPAATSPPLLAGLESRVRLEKGRGRVGGEEVEVRLTLPGARPPDAELPAAGDPGGVERGARDPSVPASDEKRRGREGTGGDGPGSETGRWRGVEEPDPAARPALCSA